MNPLQFTERKTGQLLPIKVHKESDFAFLPDPLPPKWEFPIRLWPLLAKAKEVLGRLDGIGRTLPDPQLLLSPLRRREAITSSALEGTYATPTELMLFELNQPEASKSESDSVNAWREVSNYHAALNEGGRLLNEMPFCLRLFKNLHSTLLAGVRGRHTNPGEFRQLQVAIGSDRRYIPAPASHVMECLDAMEKYLHAEDTTYDPLVRAYLVHYQFETIHPFSDGNGRIGRVVLSLMIAKWCDLVNPWLYMSAYFERYKDEYIRNLFQVSADGAWEQWIEFCLRGTIRQAEDAIRRCDQLGKLRKDMSERIKNNASPRTAQIVESLFSDPIVQVAQLSKKLSISYPTAKDDIQRLVDAKILELIDNVRPRSYFSPEIYSIAFGRDEGDI